MGRYKWKPHNLFYFWILAAVYCGLFFYFVVALLSELVGLASVVCVPVSTAHRSSR
jgi:hypothetical protein